MKQSVTRRRFLGFGAGLGVLFTAGCSLPVIPSRPAASAEDAMGWIRFHQGRYTLMLPRAEIGQNIATGLKQVAMAELGITDGDIDVRQAHTAEIPAYRATVGSESIQHFAIPLAQACATLRDAIAVGQSDGVLQVKERPYTELRAFRDQRLGGSPAPLHSGQEIVTGQLLFAADQRLPDMAYGRVLRAPVSPEIVSVPEAWNAEAAAAQPGFIRLVTGDGMVHLNSTGIGIVAETPGALDRIAEALKIRWKVAGSPGQQDVDRALDIDRRMAAGGMQNTVVDDGVDDAEKWDVDLRFDLPFAAHGAIEPRAAVARVTAGKAELWVGSQDPFFVRDSAADRLGLSKDNVIVHPMRTGGAFGGKTIPMAELEAASLSAAVSRPVKVQWTRSQEFLQAFHRPQTSHRVRARIRDGNVTDWFHRLSSGHVIFTNAGLPAWMQRLTDLIGDTGVARGALPPYNFARRQVGYDLDRLPVLTGPWRGLGAGPNGFAIECALDECARRAGVDPVDFRRRHIGDARLRAVLDRAVTDAGQLAPGQGRGVACGIYKEQSYCAVVADIRLDEDGAPKVTGMWCAHECGHVVNADQVQAQCQGNMVWGIGMALSDQLKLAEGGIAARDFADAPLPTMTDVPALHVSLLPSSAPPAGAGETVIVAAAAAIANGVRAMTGVRPVALPIRAQDLA